MKVTIAVLITYSLFFIACNRSEQKKTEATEKSQQPDSSSLVKAESASENGFAIDQIPVSEKALGNFPFFSLPQGIVTTNKPIERKFDRLFFAIDGKMVPLEGRIWKTFLSAENGQEWSLPFVENSYDKAIKEVGGVKIFDGTITKEEYDRYSPEAKYLGEEGSIGYVDETIKTYVIKRIDGGNVYIQLSGNNASGKLNILQQEGFKQTITLLKAEEIAKELSDKGKAILYINFDVDKATLKPDGKEAINEIAKALTNRNDLKVAINGYTDNTGNDLKNLTLSKNRSKTVLEALVSLGIDKSRLTSNGFGSKDPIADNATEEGKAKNRRVELIKL